MVSRWPATWRSSASSSSPLCSSSGRGGSFALLCLRGAKPFALPLNTTHCPKLTREYIGKKKKTHVERIKQAIRVVHTVLAESARRRDSLRVETRIPDPAERAAAPKRLAAATTPTRGEERGYLEVDRGDKEVHRSMG